MTRHRLVLLITGALVVAGVSVALVGRAGADGDRCQRFAHDASDRAAMATGPVDADRRILVIGDSYSVGLGVRADQSWPTRLPGRVHVAGFSGSGFSKDASECGDVSFASRADDALQAAGPVDLVVVEGGLNDYDQPVEEVRRGFDSLIERLGTHRVVIVGPAAAPSRIDRVPAVDAELSRLAAAHGATYLSMSDQDLTYLDDGLHLTPAGHVAFGDRVATFLGD